MKHFYYQSILLLTCLAVFMRASADISCFEVFLKKNSEADGFDTGVRRPGPEVRPFLLQKWENTPPEFRMTDEDFLQALPVLGATIGFDLRTGREIRHQIFLQIRETNQKVVNLLKRNNKDVSAAVRDMRKRRLKLISFLLEGDGYKASQFYENLMTVYNVSVSQLVRYIRGDIHLRDNELLSSTSEPMLLGLAQAPMFSDIRQKIVSVYQKYSGNPPAVEVLNIFDLFYSRVASEVSYVEWYLRKVETEDGFSSEQKQAVLYLRKRLSPETLQEQFDFIETSREALAQPHLNRFIETGRPQISLYWQLQVLKFEQRRSQIAFLRSFAQLEQIQQLISKSPQAIREPLMFLARMNYNDYVLDRFMDSIEAVVVASPEFRLQVFLNRLGAEGMAGQKNQEQFLETLARISSHMDIWNELKKQVADRSSYGNFKILIEQMAVAESKIKSLMFISDISDVSSNDKIMGFVIPTLLGGGYLAYTYWDQIQVFLSQL